MEVEELSKSLLLLPVLLQGTVAGFLILVLRNYKSRNILFLPAIFLCVSVPQAKRVVKCFSF